jgi:pimeloyl-ACP methyl ester carboxylesterase
MRERALNRESWWRRHASISAITVFCFAGCASLPESNHATTSDGTFSYMAAGTGSPAVVFESGLGDGKEAWRPIFAEVGKFARVFAYDRGGYGVSNAHSPDRSAKEIVEELRTLLKAAHIDPPFVLVGHSIGGLYANVFARTYPGEVAGVVFVDARHEDFSMRCKAAGAMVCEPPALLVLLAGGGAMEEYKSAPASMQQVRDAGPFPPVPVAVLTGTRKVLEGPTFNRIWLETQKEMAGMSPKGKHVICNHCGHYVQQDDPGLVIDAIRDVIARAAVFSDRALGLPARLRCEVR